MQLPSWHCYCENTTEANALCFNLGGIDVYFSYKTPVAFRVAGKNMVVRWNKWGPTTGKHLNAIDGGEPDAKKARMCGSEFLTALTEAMK